jgi:hypothetical protein
MMLLGPRITIVIWWLAGMERWESAFASFWVPFLGFFFLPWTTLVFVVVAPSGSVVGVDWLFLTLAFLGDLASYSSGAYGNRERLSGS